MPYAGAGLKPILNPQRRKRSPSATVAHKGHKYHPQLLQHMAGTEVYASVIVDSQVGTSTDLSRRATVLCSISCSTAERPRLWKAPRPPPQFRQRARSLPVPKGSSAMAGGTQSSLPKLACMRHAYGTCGHQKLRGKRSQPVCLINDRDFETSEQECCEGLPSNRVLLRWR